MASGRIWRQALLVLLLSVNAFFLFQHGRRAAEIFGLTRGLPEERRRLMMWGRLYASVRWARQAVPENAEMWWVSPNLPWLVNCLLYPRTLRWGSPRFSDLEDIRRRHPSDWAVVYRQAEAGAAEELTLYPPLRPRGGPGS